MMEAGMREKEKENCMYIMKGKYTREHKTVRYK